MELDPDLFGAILQTARKRPAVIHRNEETLESETLDKSEQIVETEKGKYVVTTTTIQTTKRFTVVREFDPESSYSDAITEFTGKE